MLLILLAGDLLLTCFLHPASPAAKWLGRGILGLGLFWALLVGRRLLAERATAAARAAGPAREDWADAAGFFVIGAMVLITIWLLVS